MIRLQSVRSLAAVGLTVFGFAASVAVAADAPVTIPVKGLFPEAVERVGPDFVVTSLKTGSLTRISPDGTATPFVAPGTNGLVSAIGLRADPARDLLYVCSSDPGVSTLTGSAAPALTAFRLSTAAPAGRWELPGGGFCNDMIVEADGTVLVTDSFNPRLLALTPGASALTEVLRDPVFKGEGFALNGIARTADGSLWVVKYDDGRLFRLAPGTAAPITEIKLSRDLGLPDGLYAGPSNSLIVVEGEGRLSRIDVSGRDGAITTLRKDLSMPTTALVENGTAWVLEAQLDYLFDPSLSGKTPGPFRLVPVALK
ncbi:NHL repeat-containing protein [Novispirillum itersonii]|uniref:hypothetical protein n=1 Tax=Novispirillum itersonii TaxID=189 RepID=UPI00036C8997|nr:hypothetical protein [Novispirillum itersonii]